MGYRNTYPGIEANKEIITFLRDPQNFPFVGMEVANLIHAVEGASVQMQFEYLEDFPEGDIASIKEYMKELCFKVCETCHNLHQDKAYFSFLQTCYFLFNHLHRMFLNLNKEEQLFYPALIEFFGTTELENIFHIQSPVSEQRKSTRKKMISVYPIPSSKVTNNRHRSEMESDTIIINNTNPIKEAILRTASDDDFDDDGTDIITSPQFTQMAQDDCPTQPSIDIKTLK
ncbi:hypothetical protein GF340_01690 [Candidatus Peregrinibacteria bacterium]|nr:hypothetical protein [Candidatus Peregrinibacteria bacterium]